jgi:hypothetical protein
LQTNSMSQLTSLAAVQRSTMPAAAIDRSSDAAPWAARREAFLQKFDASQAKRLEAQQRRKLAQDIRTRLGEIYGLMKLPAPHRVKASPKPWRGLAASPKDTPSRPLSDS